MTHKYRYFLLIIILMFLILLPDFFYLRNNVPTPDNYIFSDYIRAKFTIKVHHDIAISMKNFIDTETIESDFWFNHINNVLTTKPLASFFITSWFYLSGIKLDNIMLIPIAKIIVGIILLTIFSSLTNRAFKKSNTLIILFMLPILTLSTLSNSPLYYRSLGYIFLFIFYLLIFLSVGKKEQKNTVSLLLLLLISISLTYYSTAYIALFSLGTIYILSSLMNFNISKKNVAKITVVNVMAILFFDNVFLYVFRKSNIANLKEAFLIYISKLKSVFVADNTQTFTKVIASEHLKLTYFVSLTYDIILLLLLAIIVIYFYRELKIRDTTLQRFFNKNKKVLFALLLLSSGGAIKSLGYTLYGHTSSLLNFAYIFFIPITISLLGFLFFKEFKQKIRFKKSIKLLMTIAILLLITNELLYENDAYRPFSVNNRVKIIEDTSKIPIKLLYNGVILSSATCTSVISYKIAEMAIINDRMEIITTHLFPTGNIFNMIKKHEKGNNLLFFIPLIYQRVYFDKSGWELLPPIDEKFLSRLIDNFVISYYSNSLIIYVQ